MRRSLLILGASGSIGSQTLSVIKDNKDRFTLLGFSVGSRTRCISYILKAHPECKYVCVKEKSKFITYSKKYPNIKFYYGDDGLISLVKECPYEMMVNALVGFVGLLPTVEALRLDKIVALANKESLVVGGELINKMLKAGHGKLYPIDSEHVAIAKCLQVENKNVDKLVITASGGAFRDGKREDLDNVTAEDALKHPTWNMGAKITIDSASMVNKTFEIIEAHYLFNYPYNKIDLLLHKESYVHSLVKYNDGSYRLEKCHPDMKKPIKYALFETLCPFVTYKVKDYHKLTDLTFKDFDYDRFPVVKWAERVIKEKGTYGAVLNAANEVAVYAFLKGKIKFLDIEEIISICMKKNKNIINPSIEEIIKCDKLTRQVAHKLVEKLGR